MNTYFSKILVIFLFSIGVSSTVFPQTVKVTGFRMDEMDLSAQMPVVFDINKNPCGLLKVGLPLKGVTFEGSGVFSYEYNNGEYWVYMLEGSEYITIKTPKFHPFDFDFSESIQGKKTYVMTVKNPSVVNFITADVAYGFEPQWSFGVGYGRLEWVRFGWFVNVMTNFNKVLVTGDCDAEGFLADGAYPGYLSETQKSRLSIMAGAILPLYKDAYIRLGVGYGTRNLYWETNDGKYYRNLGFSTTGFDLSAGLQYHLHGFVISADWVTTNFYFSEVKLGLGACF